ncbi:MAG: hypothetical protein H6708_01495 [Kofleriaceae bacterium]|nr:hypothetical protein [Kofleriaceae bacterium]
MGGRVVARTAAAAVALALIGCGPAARLDAPPPHDLDDEALPGARRAAAPAAPAATDDVRDDAVASGGEVAAAGAAGGPRPAPARRAATITLTVRDADVHDVLRLIATVARRSLVVADDVAGAVTVELHDVPWPAALDAIAGLLGLAVVDRDGILRVGRAPPR